MPLLDHFGFLAPIYEKVILPKDPQDLLALTDLPISGALLDAGGGTGRVAQFMVSKANPVVVVDLSQKMLAETHRKIGLRPVCSHTESLPFPDESFARIIMVDAFHHVSNQRQTIDELWRVLQPGGRIVIEEPDVRTFTVKMIVLAEKLALMRSHFLTPQHIVSLFDFPGAHVIVKTGQFNAWVVVEKSK